MSRVVDPDYPKKKENEELKDKLIQEYQGEQVKKSQFPDVQNSKMSFFKEKSNVYSVGVFCPILEPPKCHIEQNIVVEIA